MTTLDPELSGRTALLAGVELLRGLPGEELEALAAAATPVQVQAGDTIVRQGDHGDRLYVIVSGRAEVTRRVRVRDIAVADLGPGDAFGEIALLDPAALRTATVTAVEALEALAVTGEAVDAVLAAHPELRDRMEAAVRRRLDGDVLLSAGSLSALAPDRRERLATGARREPLRAGDIVIGEGEPAETCFVLVSGEATVQRHGSVVATLGPGSLIGEVALLTGEPRTATVSMVSDGEVLVIGRAALVEALRGDDETLARVMRLMKSRIEARRRDCVIAESRPELDGSQVTILKDTERHAYYRLSELGRFVWDHLDGERSVRDLTVAAFRERGAFAPDLIAATVDGLVRAGFAEAPQLAADVTVPRRAGRLARLSRAALVALTWVRAVEGIDPLMERLYRRGRFLYHPAALAALACLLVAGLVSLIAEGSAAASPFGHEGVSSWIVLALIPAYAAAIALHELGHALTVKHFGREVNRAGVGWYMWLPTAFIDTSDMWLAGRWQRVAVTVAGPLTSALVGAIASLVALTVGDPALQAVVWQFALVNFVIALLNFNPLLEVDGYYVLMDVLERPQLRREALAWLGTGLRRDLAEGRGLEGHGLDLAYGLASLAYVAIAGTVLTLGLRGAVAGWFDGVVASSTADVVGWCVAIAALTTLLLAVLAQLRGTRLAGHTSG